MATKTPTKVPAKAPANATSTTGPAKLARAVTAATTPKASPAATSTDAAAKPAVKATVAKDRVTAKSAAAVKAPTARAKAPAVVEPEASAKGAATVAQPVPEAPAAATNVKMMKLKDLLEKVAKTTGSKKKLIRPVVEATLAALGTALAEGSDLNLQGLGKAHVNRQRENGAGEVLIIKLRRAAAI
jgi:DNA-binding protein HU-alpha